MPDHNILAIGPLTEGAEPVKLYVLMDEGAKVVKQVEAVSDAEGIEALTAGGKRDIACEPDLRAAAKQLKLPVEEPTRRQNFRRAELAIERAKLDLPVTEVPGLVRSLLQGLASLIASPAWDRMAARETAMIVVKGSIAERRCDADLSMVRMHRGDPPGLSLILAEHDPDEDLETIVSADLRSIELDVELHRDPAYVAAALDAGYDLPFVPGLSTGGVAPDAPWLRRYGPIIGAAFYVLGKVKPGDDRQAIELSDDRTSLLLQVDAGFGPP